MRTRLALLALFICCSNLIPVSAQSWDEIRSHKNVYLSGEGYGETVQEADEHALADLISQISVVVSKNVTVTDDERVDNGNFDAQSYTTVKIQSYSNATLNNTERLVISNEPDAHVGRYIKRSELDKIFEGRKLKINEYLRLAQVAVEKVKIDDALRCYYWAFSLLKTLQNPNSVTDAQGHVLINWIPQQMNEIFDDIRVSVAKVEGNDALLNFTFRGHPVTSLDYTYFDGRDWSNIYSAKDGRGVLELLQGVETQNVQLKYEYAYRGQTHIDREVETVMKLVKGKAMRKSYTNINLAGSSQPTSTKPEVKQHTDNSYSVVQGAEAEKVNSVVNAIVNAIRKKQYSSVQSYFTGEGYSMFQRLVAYGSARVLDYQGCEVFRLGNRLIARSVPMSFSFAKGVRKSFVEDVVFTFNAEGKVECVAFGLDQVAMDDVLAKTAWSQDARQVLVSFLENYKTAYALNRLDYLKSIFDDNAVIIVGHIVKKYQHANSDLNSPYTLNKYVKRTQLTKDQYMKNLEACFKSNEFVNIRFSNNQVIKAGGSMGETYGIQIKQDYYSSSYGDHGYLYLQVDMNDPDKPIIKVRTWQEEPDPEIGRPYGMQDF